MTTGTNGNSGTLPPRAVDGYRRKTLTRKRHQDGQLLKLRHGWAMRFYEESGEGQRRAEVSRQLRGASDAPECVEYDARGTLRR